MQPPNFRDDPPLSTRPPKAYLFYAISFNAKTELSEPSIPVPRTNREPIHLDSAVARRVASYLIDMIGMTNLPGKADSVFPLVNRDYASGIRRWVHLLFVHAPCPSRSPKTLAANS